MSDAIAVLNAGSSSLKFSLFAERGNALELDCARTNRRPPYRAAFRRQGSAREDCGREVVGRWRQAWARWRARSSGRLPARGLGKQRLTGIGHRVVHGGLEYSRPVRVDAAVLSALDKYVPLAPLHQPHNLAPIRALLERAPELAQVACFDTAFHRAQPEVAQAFALPRSITDRGVRRYGFHGLSYEYIAQALSTYDAKAAAGRVVVLHLGNGSSMCAMTNGRSVASTMGFTAVDGLPMGTRCGSLDPGVILYLLDELKMDARGNREAHLSAVGPARRIGHFQRHARPARKRQARCEGRDRPLRLPNRPRAGLARGRARRAGRRRLHGRDRREQRGPARAGVPRCSLAGDRARRGSKRSRRSAHQYRGKRRLGLGDPDQRRADDRTAHAGAARSRRCRVSG